jgi:hypothetical protein
MYKNPKEDYVRENQEGWWQTEILRRKQKEVQKFSRFIIRYRLDID